MTAPVNVFFAAFLAIAVFIAGCAAPAKTGLANQPEASPWHGRLAVRIDSEPPQSFAAGFELTGSPVTGELTLLTPLGSTAAVLSWTAQTVVMRANGEVRYFESLDELIRQAVGTAIPVTALFEWLNGNNAQVSDWKADLSQYAQGRITARRMPPAPAAELRLVLEK